MSHHTPKQITDLALTILPVLALTTSCSSTKTIQKRTRSVDMVIDKQLRQTSSDWYIQDTLQSFVIDTATGKPRHVGTHIRARRARASTADSTAHQRQEVSQADDNNVTVFQSPHTSQYSLGLKQLAITVAFVIVLTAAVTTARRKH